MRPRSKRLVAGLAVVLLLAAAGYGWLKYGGKRSVMLPLRPAAAAVPAVQAVASRDIEAGSQVPATAPASNLPPAVRALFYAPDLYAVHLRYRNGTRPEELYAAWTAIDVCREIAERLRAGKSVEALSRDKYGNQLLKLAPELQQSVEKRQQLVERMRKPHVARCQGFVELADVFKVRTDIVRRAAALGSLPARLSLAWQPDPPADPAYRTAWQQEARLLAIEALKSDDPLALWALARSGFYVPAADLAAIRQQEIERKALLERFTPGYGRLSPQPLHADYRDERMLMHWTLAAVLRERAVRRGYDLGPQSSAAMQYCQDENYIQCDRTLGFRLRMSRDNHDIAIRLFGEASRSDAAAAETIRLAEQQVRYDEARYAQVERMLDEAIARDDFGPLGLGEFVLFNR